MLRSLLPLVVVVLALAYFCTPQTVDPVTEVDPTSSIRYAASLSEVSLLVPELGDQWRPTSVEANVPEDGETGPVTLTIGYVSPTDEFARFVVSSDPATPVIGDLLVDAESVGPVTFNAAADALDEAVWEELRTSRGERFYLGSVGDLRLVVTGSASEDELRTLAESLRPYRG